jgi:hypothetical protein
MSRLKYINKSKLQKSFPNLAEQLEEIPKNHKSHFYWFFANYSGKYKDVKGKPRTVSIGAVLDVFDQLGYDIQINVTKK